MIKVFSFNGRLNRIEYILSISVFIICCILLSSAISTDNDSQLLSIFFIPLLWFIGAQGAKRCHDIDQNGWWQIIPFYFFVLMFKKGDQLENRYGDMLRSISYGAKDYEKPFKNDEDTATNFIDTPAGGIPTQTDTPIH